MLNWIWVTMLVAAVVCGSFTGLLGEVTKASVNSAGAAVELAIGLVGVMALWLGLMQSLQRAGLLRIVMRAISPVTTRLFPDVPSDHPAMTMIVLNMTANMLGLTNAATPFGLKAMMELDKLNEQKGTATNAMALLLAINTSNIALLPTGMIGLRASLGSEVPGSILVPTFLATVCSTLAAITAAKFFQRFFPITAAAPSEAPAAAPSAFDVPDTSESEELIHAEAPEGSPAERWASVVMAVLVLGSLIFAGSEKWAELQSGGATPYASFGHFIATGFDLVKIGASEWLLSVLMIVIVLFGMNRGVKVYDEVVSGAKEGFQVALRIIPFLVAMLVAVGMLRASGAVDLMVTVLSPVTELVGMPAEALPMALVRSLSGSGAFGVASEVMTVHGPDSLLGTMVSVMQGSSDTTFYVLAIYYGVIAIKNIRHTLIACLIADLVGALGAVWFTRIFVG